MKVEYRGDEVVISDFSQLEAYKMARRLEMEGINFYNLLKSASRDPGTKAAIDALLAEEHKHLKFFEAKAEELAGPFEEDSVVDEVDTGVFSSLGEPGYLSVVVNDRVKAIELGVLFENRSASFFEACMASASDLSAKGAFSDVIKEERGHAESLKELLRRER